MRSTIVIDDALIAEAMAATGAATKREAVEIGLKALVRLRRQAGIRDVRGKLPWRGGLEAMRTDIAAK